MRETAAPNPDVIEKLISTEAKNGYELVQLLITPYATGRLYTAVMKLGKRP